MENGQEKIPDIHLWFPQAVAHTYILASTNATYTHHTTHIHEQSEMATTDYLTSSPRFLKYSIRLSNFFKGAQQVWPDRGQSPEFLTNLELYL